MTLPFSHPDEPGPGAELALALFDEYCDHREKGTPVDVDALLARAGDAADDLRRRMLVYDQLHALRDRMEPEQPAAPTELGRFRILGSLGAGGLSHVYLAEDPNLDRQVALKVIDRGLIPDRRERAWILNEARSLSTLEHPDIVKVFEVDSKDGYDFVAMEHLSGPTLEEVLTQLAAGAKEDTGRDAERPENAARMEQASRIARSLTDLNARVRCFHRIAEALAYCHSRGVVHRDIKPSNVVFDKHANPKLIDFGLAHHDDAAEDAQPHITTLLVGAAAYIAPEQVEKNETGVDPRSDQFSLATVFYEALALANPFDAPTSLQTTQAVLRCELQPLRRLAPEVPVDLATVVHRGLERNPDDRYATVQDMADDLLAILDHRPISITKPSIARRARLWIRRHRVAVAAGVVAALAIATVWAVDVTRERARFLARLDELGVEDFTLPSEFVESAPELFLLRERSRVFDASLGHALFGPPLEDAFQATIHSWSEKLADVFREGTLRETEAWPVLLELERNLCPECPANQSERSRGRVHLPFDEIGARTWRLERMVPSETERDIIFAKWEPTGTAPIPTLGSYRLFVWDEGERVPTYEAAFVVSRRRAPERWIRLFGRDRPLLGAASNPLLEEALAVPRTTRPASAGGSDHVVPAFLVLPRFVTTREFESFLKTPEYQEHLRLTERPSCDFSTMTAYDDPAWVDLEVAGAFAAWVGGHLPSASELAAAVEHGAIELDPEAYQREWITNRAWLASTEEEGAFFIHDRYGSHDLTPAIGMNLVRTTNPVERDRGVSFRIAFVDHDPRDP